MGDLTHSDAFNTLSRPMAGERKAQFEDWIKSMLAAHPGCRYISERHWQIYYGLWFQIFRHFDNKYDMVRWMETILSYMRQESRLNKKVLDMWDVEEEIEAIMGDLKPGDKGYGARADLAAERLRRYLNAIDLEEMGVKITDGGEERKFRYIWNSAPIWEELILQASKQFKDFTDDLGKLAKLATATRHHGNGRTEITKGGTLDALMERERRRAGR